MLSLLHKKALVLILCLFFVSLVFYVHHESNYSQFIYQRNYVTKSNTVIHADTAESKSFLDVKGNHAASDNESSCQINQSRSASLPAQQFKPRIIKAGCTPYLKDLYAVPVPEHDCDQPHVVMNDGGRLGNKLCQYASLYLLRHLYGVRVSITKKMNATLSKIIKNIVLPVHDSNCFTRKTKRISYEDLCKKLYTTASQVRANTSKTVITEPLLHTSFYVYTNPAPRDLLSAHRALVQSLFKFRDEVVKAAIKNIDAALKPFNATYYERDFSIITVHVRRTDYTWFIKHKYNLSQLDELYFTRAFQFYRERLKQPVFLVLSDDPKWCKQKLKAEDVRVIASNSPAVDMVAASLGDHHVTSYGTFSFIGALLGQGHITHPINNNTRYSTNCVDSSFWHNISRDKSFKVDNSNVVL
ncbi:hypothetical protein O3P69_016663 [Scylla paramamosain]|uniref:L-Fucosyltransferase n=2 Tax=Scylla paramamosain TaxID=85552 RepID=A0AAW0SXN8_SCYPA